MIESNKKTALPNHTGKLRLALFALLLSAAMVLIFKELPYKNIENNELQVMLENNIPIYDIRRPDEWKQTGVIEDSRLLTFVDATGQVKPNFFNRFTTEVKINDFVILICRTGSRTSKLAFHLVEKLGYTNVINVDDGITEWIRGNKPVVAPLLPTLETQYNRGLL